MSTKDYIALADALRKTKPRWEASGGDVPALLQWERDIVAVADVLSADNVRFKRDVFIGYAKGECGPQGGKL